VRCPNCNKEFDYREAMMEQEWREIIDLLPAFNGHPRLAWEYVEKFSIAPLRMKSKKILRLLQEVGALFGQKRFKIGKAIYEISEKGIVEGLTVVCNKNFDLPLENHNYLKKVLVSISEREQKDRRSALDKEIKRKETGDRSQETGLRRQEPEEECLTAEENARRARELADKLKGMG
jgi:hypothetical protein